MDRAKLERILAKLPSLRVAVVGDFFLDRYFEIDASLEEYSVETALRAYQVTGKRMSPGAAGTVVSNLRALGVGDVVCSGVIGVDGEGFELKHSLQAIGADYIHLIEREDRVTPCYSKPMLRENNAERELERLDIKNRSPLPPDAEDEFLRRLGAFLPGVSGVVIADQVQERNFGVITDRVREEIARLAEKNPDKFILADSRVRIGAYTGVMIKPNMFEAVDAVTGNARPDMTSGSAVDVEEAKSCARKLREHTGKPVFMTAQENGILVVDEDITTVPAVRVEGEIDPCGAGDSCAAGIVSALCAGAELAEAALMGNIVASITVQKIGQTGTASPEEVLARYDEFISKMT